MTHQGRSPSSREADQRSADENLVGDRVRELAELGDQAPAAGDLTVDPVGQGRDREHRGGGVPPGGIVTAAGEQEHHEDRDEQEPEDGQGVRDVDHADATRGHVGGVRLHLGCERLRSGSSSASSLLAGRLARRGAGGEVDRTWGLPARHRHRLLPRGHRRRTRHGVTDSSRSATPSASVSSPATIADQLGHQVDAFGRDHPGADQITDGPSGDAADHAGTVDLGRLLRRPTLTQVTRRSLRAAPRPRCRSVPPRAGRSAARPGR